MSMLVFGLFLHDLWLFSWFRLLSPQKSSYAKFDLARKREEADGYVRGQVEGCPAASWRDASAACRDEWRLTWRCSGIRATQARSTAIECCQTRPRPQATFASVPS